jgi:hypothetical protein
MSWWRLATKRGHSFNICEFVLGSLTRHFSAKGRLEIEFYDRGRDIDDPAYVTFKPLKLHVDRKVWQAAQNGEAYARFILAHEIGHIVLHDEFALAFSDEEAAQLKYLENIESAEWQANVFADYFLVPDHIALKLHDTDVVAGLCVVTDDLAKRRLKDAKNSRVVLNPTYVGEMCSECGNFTLTLNGALIKCDTCESTMACL